MRKVTNGILCTLLFLLCLTPLVWFPGNSILLGYDNIFPLNPSAFLVDRIYSWSSTLGFSMDQSGIQGSLIIHFIDSLPQFIGFSPQVSQKIVYCFWFFLLLLAPFVLILRLEKHRIVETNYARYFFPVLYAFNFYMLQAWWIAERTKFSVAVATPLILSILIEIFFARRNVRKIAALGIITAGILSILNGGGWRGISLYGGLLAAMFCFYAFFSLFYIRLREYRSLLYLQIFFFLFGTFYLIFNAYTIIPFISTTIGSYSSLFEGAGGYDGLIGWSQYISKDTSFINLLRLQGIPDWYGNIPFHPYASEYLQNWIFIALSFVFPGLLFLFFVQRRKDTNPIIVYFILLLILSLFLTAGSHKPLGILFDFLVRHVPGFLIFRSPIFKFGYIYWLVVGLFISLSLSYGLDNIVSKIRKPKLKFVLNLALPILIVILILSYYHPYFSKNIFRIDETSVSSRVILPGYINDFSHWWRSKEDSEKILLLPKLNENWYFEIYKWNYLSLNPVIANFANNGIIENTVLLSSDEKLLLGQLYDAIAKRDYERMDNLASLLGIRYFLVRDDFYFDFPGRETDDPQELKEKILANDAIDSVADFGKWHVYAYKHKVPMFYSVSQVNIVDGSYTIGSSVDTVFPSSLSKDLVNLNKEIINNVVFFPECISCEAERESRKVIFPSPKIFPGSNLYEFVRLKERLQKPKATSFDQILFSLVGNTVKHTGELITMLDQGKEDYFLEVASSYYLEDLAKLADKIPQISSQSTNPSATTIILTQYLSTEQEVFGTYTARINKKSTQVLLENLVYRISQAREGLKKLYSEKDINTKKIYIVNVFLPGTYTLQIDNNTLGTILPVDFSKIFLEFDNKQFIPKIVGEYLDFGSISLAKGINSFILHLPQQQNLLSTPIKEEIVQRNCYSSVINSFSLEKFYDLRFVEKNNFDPNLFFFIDDAISYTPRLLDFFQISGEQENKKRYIISSEMLSVSKKAKSLRIAFCAPLLTDDRFKQSISELNVTELTVPKIQLTQIGNKQFGTPPEVTSTKNNPVSYTVTIRGAKVPFLLVGTDRFSPGWKSSIGKQYMANKFTNAWYIDKKGDFTIQIQYVPQQYAFIGFVVSLGGVLLGSLLVVWLLKHNEKN